MASISNIYLVEFALGLKLPPQLQLPISIGTLGPTENKYEASSNMV